MKIPRSFSIAQSLERLRCRLLPSSGTELFEGLESLAQNGARSAAVLLEMIRDPEEKDFSVLQSLEKNADGWMETVRSKLEHSFITPIDREDIFALSGKLDDIVDLIESIGFTVYANISFIRNHPPVLKEVMRMAMEDTRLLARHLAAAAAFMPKAVRALERKERMGAIREEVHKCEHQADLVWRSLLERQINYLDRCAERPLSGGEYLVSRWVDEVAHKIEDAIDEVKEAVDQMAGVMEKMGY